MTEEHSILVVDDSPGTLAVLERNLRAAGYTIHSATNVDEALEILDAINVDLVITDVKMPRRSGLDLVREVRDNLHGTEIMVITGFPDVDGAVTSLKHGATDYLTKPFTDQELEAAVERALSKLALRRGTAETRTAPLHGLLGESAGMRRVHAQIRRAAQTNATVLVSGESGTGKELVARAIHYESSRAAAPFVPVNCGAIPQDLFESELFGHVKGSFTGANETRAGFFLTADGGTIFLDESAETNPATQVKLLRVLQDKQVAMVGSSKPRTVDVRIVAATNKNLQQLAASGSFREDLYFRINVIPIELPPLRERGPDVLALTRHFAAKYADEVGRGPLAFSDRVLELFQTYAWPGNVRELENVVQRLVVMADGPEVDAADLPVLMRSSFGSAEAELNRSLVQVEASHIRKVLASVSGNKSKAAQILGIDRKTLRAKLRQHALPDD